ncbi:hypothetical protein [Streptomyces sp. NPDC048710]
MNRACRAADPKDRRRVIVESVPDALGRIEEVVGPPAATSPDPRPLRL